MSEKFLSESEKLSRRGESATELVRGGANLISEKELNGLRIEVTEEQIEEARREMEEYFGIIENEAEIEIRAGVEVEKVLKDLIHDMTGKGSRGIARNMITLAVMSNARVVGLDSDIKRGAPFRKISDKEILEAIDECVFDIEHAKKRIYKWIKGVEIPIIDWDHVNKKKNGNPTPILLRIEDVESDGDNTLGPEIRRIINQMFNYTSCLQVQYPNGNVDCPNCAHQQGRISGGYLQEDSFR